MGKVLQAKCPFVTSLFVLCLGWPLWSLSHFSHADAFESLSTPCPGTAVPACLDRPYTWHFARQYLLCVRIGPGPLPGVDNSARAATLSQPEASEFPSLVSEHPQVVLASGQCDWPVGVMQWLKAPMPLPPRVQCAVRPLPRVPSFFALLQGLG